jgi:hypothetical protein
LVTAASGTRPRARRRALGPEAGALVSVAAAGSAGAQGVSLGAIYVDGVARIAVSIYNAEVGPMPEEWVGIVVRRWTGGVCGPLVSSERTRRSAVKEFYR